MISAEGVADRLVADAEALSRRADRNAYSDRICPAAETVASLRPILPRFGITRLARITGLDAIGVPVWAAIRPNALTLSVSQGKGVDDPSAQASALMEAIELAVAEQPAIRTVIATAAEITKGEGAVATLPGLVAQGCCEPEPTEALRWALGYDLIQGRSVWVPAEAVAFDEMSDGGARPHRYWRSSDGLASGNLLREAVLHGMLERVERDAVALWRLRSAKEVASRYRAPDAFGDPFLSDIVARMDKARMRLQLFDITTDIGLPAFFALLAPQSDRRHWKHFDLVSGAGCHPEPVRAALRAVTEAAQSRLTVISGARDDIRPSTYDEPLKPDLLEYLRDFEAVAPGAMTGVAREVDGDPLDVTLHRLRASGVGSVIVVPLSHADERFCVAKTLVPDLENPPGNRRSRFGPRALNMMIRVR